MKALGAFIIFKANGICDGFICIALARRVGKCLLNTVFSFGKSKKYSRLHFFVARKKKEMGVSRNQGQNKKSSRLEKKFWFLFIPHSARFLRPSDFLEVIWKMRLRDLVIEWGRVENPFHRENHRKPGMGGEGYQSLVTLQLLDPPGCPEYFPRSPRSWD